MRTHETSSSFYYYTWWFYYSAWWIPFKGPRLCLDEKPYWEIYDFYWWLVELTDWLSSSFNHGESWSELFVITFRSCGKVMFLQLSVNLFTGVYLLLGLGGREVSAQGGVHPAWTDTAPGRYPPPLGRHHPGRTPPPPPRLPLQWTIRILLECILVYWKKLPQIGGSLSTLSLA